MAKIDLQYTHGEAVAEIILSDPKNNVLDKVMMNELLALIPDFRKNDGLKLITFEGAGDHFSFGASVEEHQKEQAPDMIATFHKLLIELSELHIPMLSKVSGYCLGGAMELALITHFIFADKSAIFGQPEIHLSVFPPPASILLPLKIGYGRAEELLLTGKNIASKQAFQMKMVNHLFKDKERLDKKTNKWIEQNIIPKSAVALRYATKASRLYLNSILKEYLSKLESIYINELMETEDANEGILSFLEKRRPVWHNA